MTVKFNSVLIRLFFIAIFISATTIAYILLPNNNTQIPIQAQLPIKEQNTTTTPAVILSTPAVDKESFKKNTTNLQTATFSVNDQNYTLQFNTDENLLTAMRRLETSSTVPFVFVGREYAGLGFFVDEINGLKTDPNAGKYWIYYVNGEPAKIGISNYLLKSGDIIKWTYENSKF